LRLGEWGGERMIFWTRRAFQVAVDNLLHAYPNMTRDEAEALATRVYRHFGRAAVEMVLAHRLLRPSTFRDHVVLRNEHYFRDVLAAGKGAIFLTGHLGVWEVFGLLLNHWGAAPASVYRPIKNPLLDRYVRRRRAEFGQRMVERQGAMPTLLRILRRGGYIALLVDQHAKADGTWVPFFGRPASTTPAPALLALRTGAPIVMGYGCRLTGLYKFEAFCDEPIYAKPSGDRAADIVRVTAEITRRIETYVRAHPDQWLWMHRRWKEPPPHVLAAQHAAASPARP
jgi:KDO2-lipid IV(A) lauroyltransferase